ncbi:hypothetical protein JCM19992_19390 [Thermostilla marina]
MAYALERKLRPTTLELAIRAVAWTASVAPEESIELLRRCLVGERVGEYGHSDLPAIAQFFAQLADVDEGFVIDFVETLCNAEASRDDWEPFGSRILPMRISRRDLLDMAYHELENQFGQIMQRHPSLGARILIVVLDSHIRKRYLTGSQPAQSIAFGFRGKQAQLVHDASERWAFDRPSVQDELWYKLCTSFRATVRQFCEQGARDQVDAILDTFAEHATWAVLWNQLLLAAMEVPQVLAPSLVELLCAPAILEAVETSVTAGRVLEQAYPHLDFSARRRIEEAIMALPGGSPEENDAERRRRIRDRLIGCIRRDLLATQQARNLRDELDAVGGPPENRLPVKIEGPRFISADEHLRSQGVDLDRPENAEFRAALKEVEQFERQWFNEALPLSAVRQFLPQLQRFQQLLAAAKGNGVDPLLHENAEFHIYACCEVMSRCPELVSVPVVYAYVRQKLLEGASHPVPEYRQEDDERWDEPSSGWGSPLPRIDAAQGLMNLARRLGSPDPQILEAIKKLAEDPVPAVRHMIASDLLSLWRIDQKLFWKLAEHFSHKEARIGVLRFFVYRVLLELSQEEADRVQPLVAAIHSRMLGHPKGSPVREECAEFFLRRALWDRHEDSLALIKEAIDNPIDRQPELQTVVRLVGDLVIFDDADRSEDDNRRIRQQAIEWLVGVFRSVDKALAPLLEKARKRQLAEEGLQQLSELVQLQESIVHQVLSVSENLNPRADQSRTAEALDTVDDTSVLDRFVKEADDLLDAICECRFARLAYDVLKTLQNLRRADPQRMFRLVAKAAFSAKEDALQFEPLAADKVVDIVETYLAEHRGIFRNDPQLLGALLDLLDLFVEAGWPKAAALVYRLDEVFRG